MLVGLNRRLFAFCWAAIGVGFLLTGQWIAAGVDGVDVFGDEVEPHCADVCAAPSDAALSRQAACTCWANGSLVPKRLNETSWPEVAAGAPFVFARPDVDEPVEAGVALGVEPF